MVVLLPVAVAQAAVVRQAVALAMEHAGLNSIGIRVLRNGLGLSALLSVVVLIAMLIGLSLQAQWDQKVHIGAIVSRGSATVTGTHFITAEFKDTEQGENNQLVLPEK